MSSVQINNKKKLELLQIATTHFKREADELLNDLEQAFLQTQEYIESFFSTLQDNVPTEIMNCFIDECSSKLFA